MREHTPNRRSVLLVDDDAALRQTVSELLEAEGYRVIAVETSEDARTVIEIEMPALMLLDSGARALESADDLRFPEPHPPIVILSAGAHLERVAEKAGAVAWLAKPFEVDDLLEIVDRYASKAVAD